MTARLRYTGNPETAEEQFEIIRATERAAISRAELDKARAYRPSRDLTTAVNVALTLRQPLLLTGEPGTGKTMLAYAVALELGLWPPMELFVKSTTSGRDLLYSFDELARFRDIQERQWNSSVGPIPLKNYLSFNALGKAILFAGGPDAEVAAMPGKIPDAATHEPPRRFGDLYAGGFSSNSNRLNVVLIDELDKAPRDTPNDLLTEIERMQFDIPELAIRIRAPAEWTPIVIITSNSEKSLPDAFLRRCIYFNIPFPGDKRQDTSSAASDPSLYDIVYAQMPELRERRQQVADALDLFMRLRIGRMRKPPATAELLDFLYSLVNDPDLPPNALLRHRDEVVRRYLPVVIKTREDQIENAPGVFEKWKKG